MEKKPIKNILIYTPYFYPEPFPINSFVDELTQHVDGVTVVTGLPNYRKYGFYEKYSFFGPYIEKKKKLNILRLPVIPRYKNSGFSIFLFYTSFVISSFLFFLFYSFYKRNNFQHLFTFCGSPVYVGFIGSAFSKILNCKSSLWIQDIWPEAIQSTVGLRSNLIAKTINFLQNKMWSSTDLLFAQSEALANHLKDKFVNKKIYTLHNPARDNLDDVYTFKKNKISITTKKTFTYLGNIGGAQSIDLFLDAFVKVDQNIYKLNMCGDGSNLDFYKSKYNLPNIKWHGWVEKKHIEIIAAETDFFILSLNSIGRQSLILPSKLQTYFQFQKPVICLSKGASSLLIKQLNSGYVCESLNVEEIITVIKKAINTTQSQQNQMSLRAFNYYKDHLDKKNIVNHFISCIF